MLPNKSNSLAELETIIEEGIATFYAVGSALLEIKDRALFQPDYSTFEEYCKSRWNLNASQVSRRLQSAEIILNLDGPNPKYESHALELGRIEDPNLRNMAWAAAQERFGDEITNKNLSQVVSEFVAINDPQLKRLVVTQVITAKHAAELIQVLSNLPDYYGEAVKRYGISDDSAISAGALRILRRVEYYAIDEVHDVLRSGYAYINERDVPLYALTEDLAEFFAKIVNSAIRSELQAVAAQDQDSNSGARIVSGENYSNLLNQPQGSVVWFFPERLSPEEVLGLMEAAGLDIYMLVGYNKGAKINFDGEVTDISRLGGVKPQTLIDAIENLTCERD